LLAVAKRRRPFDHAQMDEAPAAISLDNVTVAFEGRRAALDDLSLKVRRREFVAIVGPSGSGKTTLLRLINRLAQPDSGTVYVEGADVCSVDAIALRRRIGYVFQNVGLFPHMSVADNIGITPKLLGQDQQTIAARVDELLDLVRLDSKDYRHRFPHQLSGGQRQRVGVARALAAKPKIVLMDEPLGALDPLTRDALGQDYRRLHDELGLTTVMITHDMLEAVLLADRVAVIQDGKVIADGTAQSLMAEDQPDYVHELMRTPRRQAERLRVLLDRSRPP
jgi:osmoprotectant transport system ATP-binding protein